MACNNYTWDALNRLCEVDPDSARRGDRGLPFDALNRRIRKRLCGSMSSSNDGLHLSWLAVRRGPQSGCRGRRRADDSVRLGPLPGRTHPDDDVRTYCYWNPLCRDNLRPGAYYPLQDLLYRTTATTDSSANIVEVYDYDAYGNTLIFNAVGGNSAGGLRTPGRYRTRLCQFLFTGQRFDAETGLYYYKRREYSPAWGRFLSEDPIGFAADENQYRYVRDAPTRESDPFGLISPVGEALDDGVDEEDGAEPVPGTDVTPSTGPGSPPSPNRTAFLKAVADYDARVNEQYSQFLAREARGWGVPDSAISTALSPQLQRSGRGGYRTKIAAP